MQALRVNGSTNCHLCPNNLFYFLFNVYTTRFFCIQTDDTHCSHSSCCNDSLTICYCKCTMTLWCGTYLLLYALIFQIFSMLIWCYNSLKCHIPVMPDVLSWFKGHITVIANCCCKLLEQNKTNFKTRKQKAGTETGGVQRPSRKWIWQP